MLVIGANSSISKALVPELMNEYDNILLTENEREYNILQDKVQDWKRQYSDKNIMSFSVDVLNKSDIDRLESSIEQMSIKLDTFLYLAGINILMSALDVTENMWDRVMNINLKGFFFTSQMVARNMIMNGGGSILGIASQHGVVANIDRAAYCASKAGMIHLAKELALEWSRYNIRVNVVSPTMILSDKNRCILEGAHAKKEYLKKIPLKMYASPEDVSDAIVFLSSDRSKMITGHNLVVDGGWTIS